VYISYWSFNVTQCYTIVFKHNGLRVVIRQTGLRVERLRVEWTKGIARGGLRIFQTVHTLQA
jgi:hypothetical protein